MTRLIPLLLLGAIACKGEDPSAEPGYIAPLDGQSGVPLDLDLVIHAPGLSLPPDWPVEGLVQVVDLEDGGIVPGALSYEGTSLRFRPSDAWKPGRRYAWTVDPIEDIPHAPEVELAPNLRGTAVFDTSADLVALAAAVEGETTCLVFSRPLTGDDDGTLRVTADDVEVEGLGITILPRDAWGVDYELDARDPGVGVGCLSGAFASGQVLRVWWGFGGPWRVEVEDGGLPDVMDDLRRRQEAP